VLGRCRGGFLLSEPENALAIVKAVTQAVGGRRPVTVKMRRGFDDSPGSERNFFSILDGALGLGAAAITVHGRTVRQRYIGPSNWKFLARVKRHAGPATILGSGDLFTARAVVRMMNETGVDGVTVARGAIGNPFIFRECRALLQDGGELPPPSISEQREALELHLAESMKLYDGARASASVRKSGIAYAGLHPMGDEVRQAFIDARKIDDVRAVLTKWYDPRREWPKVERRERLRDLIAAGADG
jgi:tRNA-dihydrouridine synthase